MTITACVKNKAKPKQDQRLDTTIIAIAVFDALQHYPDAFQRKDDIAMLATKFAMFFIEQQSKQQSNEVQKRQYSIEDIIANYICGYLYETSMIINASDKERQEIIDVFQRINDGDDDLLSSLFDAILEVIEDRVKTTGVDTVSAFCEKAMQDGEGVMRVIGSDVETLVGKKD